MNQVKSQAKYTFIFIPLLPSRCGLFLRRKLFGNKDKNKNKDKDSERETLIVVVGVIIEFTTTKAAIIKAIKLVTIKTIIKVITIQVIIKTTSTIIKANTLVFQSKNKFNKSIKEFIVRVVFY